jgi:tetratricopeptide (TPR) repeat protein
VLSGCAWLADPPQTAALALSAPVGLPPRLELTRVPFFPQTPYHCGPAALATVLGDIGLKADPEGLAGAVFLPAREGSLQLEMLGAARSQGAMATVLPGELEALLRELAAGHAVLVLQNRGLNFAPMWHYAVLVGYDLPARELVFRSGTLEREVMSLRTFENIWARGGRWAVAVLPPGQLPVTAREAEAVEGALGFGRVAAPSEQVPAWRAVSTRWPDNLLAALGLGNALYAKGDLDAAAATFESAARRHDSAVAWNNLAMSLQGLGNLPGARDAARHAVARARAAEPVWLPMTQQLQSELEAAPH